MTPQSLQTRPGLGNWNRRREPRVGVMLHYDGSANDAGAVAWLTRDPRCKVSYNVLVLDDGSIERITPEDARAWHAGACRPSSDQLGYRDANSAFYGFCIAARPGDRVSDAQCTALVRLCVAAFRTQGWPLSDAWRITEHRVEAWPRGRKVDLGAQLIGVTLDLVRSRVSNYVEMAA